MASSIAECARRFLRTEGAFLRVPTRLMGEAHETLLCVTDVAPSLLLEAPEESPHGAVEVVNGESLLARLGGEEPDMDVCWVPVGEPESIWDDLAEVILALASAGYPGCAGCGGPEASEPWDEASRRPLLMGG